MKAHSTVKLHDVLRHHPHDEGKIDQLLSICATPELIERMRDVEVRQKALDITSQVVNYIVLAVTADTSVDIDPGKIRAELEQEPEFAGLAKSIVHTLSSNQGLDGMLTGKNPDEPDRTVFLHRLKLLTG